MNKLRAAAENNDAAFTSGVEVQYSPNGTDFFRVRILKGGTANNALMKAVEVAMRPYRDNGLDMNDLDPEVQKAITAKIFSETIVVGWNEEDFGVAFSPAECEATMKADTNFAEFITKNSNKALLFRKKALTDAAGN